MRHRLVPVILLFFLSPLIAEYLLGSLPTSMIAILPLMAMLYGSGAIVIRELVRRSSRGWPSMILLAAAYGFVEEGLITQSLFNPNYLHLRLLDYGWIPALGTSAPWLIYVISLHVFWSISVPIGLTEALFPGRRDTPWLGKIGLGVFVMLFLAGATLTAAFTYKQFSFIASRAQLGTTAAIAAALAIVAFLTPRRPTATGTKAPHAAILFLAGFLPGSAFVGMELIGQRVLHLPWPVPAATLLGVELLLLTFMLACARGRQWSDFQRFALVAGGLGVYFWLGFPIEISLHGTSAMPGHVVVAVVILILAIIAGRRAFNASH